MTLSEQFSNPDTRPVNAPRLPRNAPACSVVVSAIADTRTEQGTRQVYGGLYPAAVLYLPPAYARSNPKTVQSLTNAFVRGLKWMASHSAEGIAKVIPAEHALGNMELFTRAIKNSLPMYSPDGRFHAEAIRTLARSMVETGLLPSEPDMSKLYTEDYLPSR